MVPPPENFPASPLPARKQKVELHTTIASPITKHGVHGADANPRPLGWNFGRHTAMIWSERFLPLPRARFTGESLKAERQAGRMADSELAFTEVGIPDETPQVGWDAFPEHTLGVKGGAFFPRTGIFSSSSLHFSAASIIPIPFLPLRGIPEG